MKLSIEMYEAVKNIKQLAPKEELITKPRI